MFQERPNIGMLHDQILLCIANQTYRPQPLSVRVLLDLLLSFQKTN